MRLNIIDPNTLDLLGVLTQYQSVQWTPTFNTPDGSFQINCSTDYIDLLQVDTYVENTEELDHVGVIKRVQTVTSNQKTSLQVDGVMLERDIFYKRVVKAWIVYQDMYPTTILSSIIGLSLTEPSEPERVVPNIGKILLPKDSDVPDMEKIEYSANFPNLGDEVFNLIQNLNLGVKSRINHNTHKIDIEFYVGYDHTFGSDEPIVFSPERGTVVETTYAKDSSQNITHLVAIGEDNVILQAERERLQGEPIIEKSLDLSSECPWPTYKVEKPDEDGGQYYRYKKYNPPADFITNRDVWEKYAVDRIETQETRYKEVEVEVSKSITLDEFLSNPEIMSNSRLDPSNGMIIGSPVPTGSILENAMLNATAGGSPVNLGSIVKSRSNVPLIKTLSVEDEAVQFTTDPNAVKPPLLKPAKNRLSAIINNTSRNVAQSPNKVGKTSKNGLGASLSKVIEIGGNKEETTVSRAKLQLDTNQEVDIITTEVQLEEYQVTVVTYETRDFLEYVYVNPGDNPSEATKVIQGSASSGDVMYYEHFEDVRVEEVRYREALMKKTKEYLKTFVISESVTAKPYYLSNVVYGETYALGDLVTARNSKLGYAVDLRVTQITEIWDDKGYSIDVTLGDTIPTLTNRIKLIAKGGA